MMGNNIKFANTGNYLKLFNDERFWNSLINTLYYTAASVPLQVLTALLVSVAINTKSKYNALLKSIYFLPAICSMTVISIIWSFLLDKDIGIISYYLSLIGVDTIAWLKDPVWAMPTIILVSVWKTFGFNMVILLAGLQGISESYYEAADMDGAGKVRQFFSITLPMLMPTLGFVIITSIINSFQVFDQVFVMTRGGPLFKTETIVQYIYHVGFEVFNLGYASAAAEHCTYRR
jgi:multiple sugar transport system permease protein